MRRGRTVIVRPQLGVGRLRKAEDFLGEALRSNEPAAQSLGELHDAVAQGDVHSHESNVGISHTDANYTAEHTRSQQDDLLALN